MIEMQVLYKYTLCFIQRKNEILLLNRNSKPEMGVWNGVGGKIELNETPEQCVVREAFEETDINLQSTLFAGRVTWVTPQRISGMYVFLSQLSENFHYITPKSVDEGILEWKPLSWILDPNNKGISNKIQDFLPAMLDGIICDHRFTYDSDDNTISYVRLPISDVQN